MTKKMMKKLVLVMAVIMLCFAVGMTASAEVSGDYNYKVLDDGTVDITGYNGNLDIFEIPSEIEGKMVSKISWFGDAYVTTIIIPASVKEIGDYAFVEASNMSKYIVDADNSNFCTDDYGVLYSKDKTNLLRYTIGSKNKEYSLLPTTKTISNHAFANAFYIEKVIMPEDIVKIGEEAFLQCLKLDNIVFPESLEIIETQAFVNCLSITDIVVPASLKYIGMSAFVNIPYLEAVYVEGLDATVDMYALCMNEIKVFEINKEDFIERTVAGLSGDRNAWDEVQKHMIYGEFRTGTIYCHASSTAEAYAIENGIDYVLTHFYEDEWTYDHDNMIKYRKCIHCDELETEKLKPTEDDDIASTDDDFFSKLFDFINALIDLLLSIFK